MSNEKTLGEIVIMAVLGFGLLYRSNSCNKKQDLKLLESTLPNLTRTTRIKLKEDLGNYPEYQQSFCVYAGDSLRLVEEKEKAGKYDHDYWLYFVDKKYPVVGVNQRVIYCSDKDKSMDREEVK